MIAASKERNPSSAKPSTQTRDRRVSFAVSTTEDATDKITQPSLPAFPYPAKYVPHLAPAAYGASSAFWGPTLPHYAPIMPPISSYTAALSGRLLPLSMGLFAQRYIMIPRPHLMQPASRSETFKPVPDAEVSSEVPSKSNVKSTLLRTVGIGAVLVALLAVLITVAVVIDFQASSVLSETSAMPLLLQHVHSDGVNIPLSMEPPKKLAEDKATSIAHFIAKSRRAVRNERPVPTALHRDKPAISKRRVQETENATRQLPQQCGRHLYTYCHRQKNQTFYSSSSHACISTAVDNVPVCNRGENRFSSLGSCLSNCVRVTKGREIDRCYESTLFTDCSRQDVAETWWYFDGSACREWTFPLGNCPSQRARVFQSQRECATKCLRLKRNDTAYAHHCDEPVTATCSPQQIMYPYFADMQVKGNERCVMASPGGLRTRRCLIGYNQFDSVASCEKACVHF